MPRVKPVLWILLGVVVGVSGHALVPSAAAQINVSNVRVTERSVPSSSGQVTFVLDKQSGGCWIKIEGAIAAAPTAACY